MQSRVERIIGVIVVPCTTPAPCPSATGRAPTSRRRELGPRGRRGLHRPHRRGRRLAAAARPGRRRHPGASSRSRASTRMLPVRSLTPAEIVSVVLDGTRRHRLMLYRLVRTYLHAVRRDAGRAPRPPAGRHARLAVPAQPERPDHRRGRRRRRHQLHPRGPAWSCSPCRSCRSSRRSAPPGSVPRPSASLGREVRSSVFRRVGEFSAQELSRFGAPTLVSRSTNDVTQVQTVTYMVLAMMVSAPIMMVGGIFMALREDVGLSWLVAVAVPALGVAIGLVISRMVPHFRLDAEVGRLGEPHPARADHRRARRARLRPRGRRARALRARPTRTYTGTAAGRRPADGAGLPASSWSSSTPRRSRCCGSAPTGSTTARCRSARSPRSWPTSSRSSCR